MALWAIPAIMGGMGFLGQMLNQPGSPNIPSSQINIPDRSKYADLLLQRGFDTDTSMYRSANERMMAELGRQLANRGLGSSSFAMGAMTDAQTNFQNQLLQDQMARMNQAYGTVRGSDIQEAQVRAGMAARATEDAWKRYAVDSARQRAPWENLMGLGNLAGQAIGSYRADQAQNAADARADKYMDWLTSYSPTRG